jgi:archaeal flagellar protein FlaH
LNLVLNTNKNLGIISTGNDELDKKMGGGIPANSLTLVEGQPDSGKSVLLQQMVWGSLKNRYKIALFSTENTVKSLVVQMQSLNLDILDYLLLDKLLIYPVDTKKATRSLNEGLFPLIQTCARKGVDLVVIDSITYYATHVSVTDLITFFEDCKSLNRNGISMICSVHSYAFDENTLVRLGAMCDAHLKLRIESMGAKLIKILEVCKVRGAIMKTGNIVSFDVEPNWGIRVIPYSKARA